MPVFWDDVANFHWMYARPLRSIWVEATGAGRVGGAFRHAPAPRLGRILTGLTASLLMASFLFALRSANHATAPHAYRALALSLGYWLLASAPTLLALPFSHLIVSPRLQVFPSRAVAIQWAYVILLVAEWAGRRGLRVNPAILQLGVVALGVLAPVAPIAPPCGCPS